jgi:SAM-dependent methyltransferase
MSSSFEIPPLDPGDRINESFRDPGGSLFRFAGRILRAVNSSGSGDLEAYLHSPHVQRLRESGSAVGVIPLDQAEQARMLSNARVRALWDGIQATQLLEHEAIPFPSFPYEWAPEMLFAAAKLTIEMAMGLIGEGLGLKDATPLNILFRGPKPVFIDALSVERREPGDARWLAYAQFVRTFLLPLAMNKEFGLRMDQVFLAARDGVEPEEIYRLLKPWQRLKRPYFGLVTMPRLLGERRRGSRPDLYKRRLDADPERALFVMTRVLSGLDKALRRVSPPAGVQSDWSNYMDGNNNYSTEQFRFKEKFVSSMLSAHRPPVVLDVGCNNGHFSAMAARNGASVVAIDYDPVVVGQVWRTASAENLNILPLVVNLTRPTPSIGWMNREWPSFLSRATGHFDCVLMLAVLHHMLVTERIPLPSVINLAADLTRHLLVLEYVGPSDSMFQRLARGREALHASLCPEQLEAACLPRFEILRRDPVPGADRILYLLAKKA